MKTKMRTFFSGLMLLAMASTAVAQAQNNFVDWWSFNSGYSEALAGNTMLRSVVGQTFTGRTEQAATQILVGFLASPWLMPVAIDEPSKHITASSVVQNYPNPFNSYTKINYTLAPFLYQLKPAGKEPIRTILRVCDMLGNEVARLVDDYQPEGKYEVEFSGVGLASGVYFCHIQIGSYAKTIKMIKM